MKEIEQSITGDNNVQIGVNNVIHTQKVKQVTEVLHSPELHITDAEALIIKNKIIEIAEMAATNTGDKASLIKKEYNTFYKKIGSTSYNLVPK